MGIGPEIDDWDMAAIRQLVAIDRYEIRGFTEETRLKFNSLVAVRVFWLRVWDGGQKGEVEIVHWVVDDEWELAYFTLS